MNGPNSSAATPVAITGIGVVCAVARDQEEFLGSLRAGRSGIAPIERFDLQWLPVDLAGEVKGFDLTQEGFDPEEISRADGYALVAAQEALAQAGLDLDAFASRRVGVSLGTCQGSVTDLVDTYEGKPDHRRWQSSADVLARRYGAGGLRAMISNACASGSSAIAVAAEKLRQGEVDVVLAGGTDELALFTLAGFAVLDSLDPRGCSPYARSEGLTVGEGAGILVLERVDDARRRGATVIAELAGYGLSADGHHPTAPDPTGRGAALAMARALTSAGLAADDVDYVNGHGTGTSANDSMERRANKALFGERAPKVPMSSTKSMIGHLLGAAGAVEAITCVLAITDGLLPPTVNVPAGAELDIDCVPNTPRSADVEVTLSNNYAFGGSNSSLVITRPGAAARRGSTPVARPDRRVVISGVGCVGGGGLDLASWSDRLAAGDSALGPLTGPGFEEFEDVYGAPAPKLDHRHVAPSSLWRKMDPIARLCTVSCRQAWDDAGLDVLGGDERADVGIFLATSSGSLEPTMRFGLGARTGRAAANPKDFPHTSPNSPAGHVATLLGLHGPTLSFSTGGVASLSALSFAADLVRAGVADRILVMAAEELSPAHLRLSRQLGVSLAHSRSRPFDAASEGSCLGSAAVTLVLEAEDSAAARGCRPRAELLSSIVYGSLATDEAGLVDDWASVLRAGVARAGLSPADVSYCAAAATGAPDLDAAEAQALADVFGPGLAVGAPKSIVGDCQGAAGLVNALAAIVAVSSGRLTPTADLVDPLPGVTHVREPTTSDAVRYVLANANAPLSNVGTAVFGAMPSS